MDPTPPRKPKDLQFYETPDHVKTSAKIISEAKNSLGRPGLRSIHTKRPVTPQDAQRKLFGDQSTRDPSTRPPSAFSLGSRHFDSDRPVSGTRLAPLDYQRQRSLDNESVAPRPPPDPNRSTRRPSSKQRSTQHSSNYDESDVPVAETTRRIHSGSKDRPPSSGSYEKHLESEEGVRPDTRSGQRQDVDRAESGYASDIREGSAGSQRNSSAGKLGSAGRRDEESPEESLYYNTHIAPIVDEMATHIKDKEPDKLMILSDTLFEALKKGDLLGKACKRRAAILKTVFKLLDLDNPKLLLKLARLILALKVSGNNLTNVCKLVFKVSKEEKHDSFFLEGNILDLLLELTTTTDPTMSSDALVYAVGSLKFLSGNADILRYLVKHNALACMAKLLKNINKMNADNGKAADQAGHILVQLTALMRNLADASATRTQFISLNLIQELGSIMELYQTDGDLMLNISRIFSKLTTNAECCREVSRKENHFKSFVLLLKIYQRREDLVLRICYILGNLTAKYDESRVQLFKQTKAFDTMIAVMKYYLDLDSKAESSVVEANKDGATNKHEDVLIKLLRVIANLAINEEIGIKIASKEICIKLLLDILDKKSLSKSSAELVLNAVATINNLSFYNSTDSAVLKIQLQVAQSLLQLMTVENMEGLVEATRVYGNLSRERRIRDFLMENKIDEMMVAMLDSGKPEVVFSAVGVLINLMADEDKRALLKRLGGIQKLIEVLRDLGRTDWQLASMVCQTLWNYSGRITSTTACFGQQQAQDLTEILLEYLDEDLALDESLVPEIDKELGVILKEKWENEFCPVASRLLQRIESHGTDLEPLDPPS